MTYTLRAALAVALLLGAYLFGAGLLAVLGYLVLVAVAAGHGAALRFGVVFVIAGIAIGRGLLSSLRTPPDDPDGIVLSRDAQPRLWAEVTELAGRVGVDAPDEIRLVAAVNAAVTERSRWLGLVGGLRRMYIGVPLLVGLSEQQLRSVLAHELGHYSGRHTALAGVTYRGMEAIGRVMAELGDGTLLARLYGLYGRLYMAVAHAVNRRQELEADRFSAQIAGRAAAIGALRELPVIAAAWAFFIDNYAGIGHQRRERPAQMLVGFHHLWTDPQRRDQLAAVRAEPPPSERSVYDTHPSPAERIAAFEALPDDGRSDRSDQAIGMLDDPVAVLAELETAMFADTELETVDWEQLVAESAAHNARTAAGALAAAAEDAGLEKATLWAIVHEVRAGGARRLVAPLLPDDAGDEQADAAATHLIGQTICAALVDSGIATFRLDWGAAAPLVDRDGDMLDPWPLVERAVATPDAVDDLERWLAAHDAPAGYRAEPDEPATDGEPVLHGAIEGVTERPRRRLFNQTRYLLVLDRGLLLRGVHGRERWAYVWDNYIGGSRGLDRVVQTPAADLIAHPRTTLLPWSDITGVHVERTVTRQPKLTITMADGTDRTVKTSIVSDVRGEPFIAMRHHLGQRMTGL
jgi:Zn-dependent protease with chaperone function